MEKKIIIKGGGKDAGGGDEGACWVKTRVLLPGPLAGRAWAVGEWRQEEGLRKGAVTVWVAVQTSQGATVDRTPYRSFYPGFAALAPKGKFPTLVLLRPRSSGSPPCPRCPRAQLGPRSVPSPKPTSLRFEWRRLNPGTKGRCWGKLRDSRSWRPKPPSRGSRHDARAPRS